MYLGPTVQEFLPEGGDTRKMANLLLAVTVVGCIVFTLYASTLFFRHKSREFGIFLALGEPKSTLAKVLFTELFALAFKNAIWGIIAALPASFFIWKLFEHFLVSTDEMTYRFGIGGIFAGLCFALLLMLLLAVTGRRFVKKSDIMDILRTSRKTELAKEVSPRLLPTGILLMILGLFGGLGINPLSVRLFHRAIPGTSLLYALSLIGIYLILLSVVSQNRLRKNKRAFYKNMVSVSLMRFSARSTTRNMCVIVLLLFACMFSSFYGMLYSDTSGNENFENSRAFALHYPTAEKQITKQEIFKLADKHGAEITNYAETNAASLVISYRNVDFDEETNEYFTQNSDKAKLALFLSENTYKALTGRDITVAPGSYQTIVSTDYKENVWEFRDGLYEITNPDRKRSLSLTYGGFVEYDALYAMSSPFAYVLSNSDYQSMTNGLSEEYTEHLVLFDVADYEDSYAFAKDVFDCYTNRATGISNHAAGYDAWEAKLYEKSGEEYGADYPIDISPDNAMLTEEWEYAPDFAIVTTQNFMQLISVYVMLCLYIFIITLSAVAVMCYVRSISVAENNKEVFASLMKLGANTSYRRTVLKKQLSNIFRYPAILGCGLGFLFALGMCITNDWRITAGEAKNLVCMFAIATAVSLFMYIVYRAAFKKAEMIISNPN